jgi:hypothetical protein
MRRLWPAAAAATVLMLGGCSDEPPAADAPTVAAPTAAPSTAAPSTATPSTPAPSTPAAPAGESPGRTSSGTTGFVSVVRAQLAEVAADRSDDDIAAIARQACTSLAAGDDADAVIAATRSLGTADAEAVDQATARELIKLAIDTVCPDQDRRVDEF